MFVRILLLLLVTAIVKNDARDSGFAPKRILNDGRYIPSLGFGTWLGFNEQCDDVIKPVGFEVEQAVSWALDAGYRHFDTAFAYATEQQVGQAINKKIADGSLNREDVFVTTKLPNIRHAREAVLPALRESLQLLNMSYVDLYLIHFPVAILPNGSFDNTDYLEAWKGLIDAQALGLTKSIGVSNFNQTMMERIIAMTGVTPAVLQVEVNLNLQQSELLDFCRKHEIHVVGYTPFGSLFHSRAAVDAPPPRVDDPCLVFIAQTYNKTVSQIVLRYMIELGVTPIPKSLTKSRIEANAQVFDFQLSQKERQLLRSYDNGYKSQTLKMWSDSPYYPFKKN